jgi:hypothetical protein
VAASSRAAASAGRSRPTAPRLSSSWSWRRAPTIGQASALTWLGERLYHLAATATPPFDDTEPLVDTLTTIWAAVLYRPQ